MSHIKMLTFHICIITFCCFNRSVFPSNPQGPVSGSVAIFCCHILNLVIKFSKLL